jgi:hypothetical protein
LDIFEQIASTSELAKEFVKRELLIQCWKKHATMFPTIGFLTQQILGVVGIQIETKRDFFWLEFLLILGVVVCKQKI